MKALIFLEPWKVDLINVDIPKPKANEAVDAFKYYDREKWIKVIVEPHR